MLGRIRVVLILVLLEAVLAVAVSFGRWVVRTRLLQRVELLLARCGKRKVQIRGSSVVLPRVVAVVVGRHIQKLALAVELGLWQLGSGVLIGVVAHSAGVSW